MQAVEATLNVSSPSLEGATPLCRDSQGNEMLQVIQLHVNSKQGGSIYVSGVPGTGMAALFCHSRAASRSNRSFCKAFVVASPILFRLKRHDSSRKKRISHPTAR